MQCILLEITCMHFVCINEMVSLVFELLFQIKLSLVLFFNCQKINVAKNIAKDIQITSGWNKINISLKPILSQ